MLKPLLTIALLSSLSLGSACSTTHAAAATPSSPTIAKEETDAIFQLAARRAQMIGWLHDYAQAGEFPTDIAGMPASMFIGENGARCPMAELIHKSGRDDLVAAVAKDNNFVRLADVHEGPLHDWMLSSGLTMDEINMIQGLARVDYAWMRRQAIPLETGPTILAAKAQMRGKAETVEVALRDNTGTSLASAKKRIPAKRSVDGLANAPIVKGAVVPKPTRAELVAQVQAKAELQARVQLGAQLQSIDLNPTYQIRN
jgi:hypothetical protein